MSPIPQTKTKTRNKARHNHAGIGVCSPNPAQTPAIFLSVADFFKFRTLSQKALCLLSIIHLRQIDRQAFSWRYKIVADRWTSGWIMPASLSSLTKKADQS